MYSTSSSKEQWIFCSVTFLTQHVMCCLQNADVMCTYRTLRWCLLVIGRHKMFYKTCFLKNLNNRWVINLEILLRLRKCLFLILLFHISAPTIIGITDDKFFSIVPSSSFSYLIFARTFPSLLDNHHPWNVRRSVVRCDFFHSQLQIKNIIKKEIL